MKSSARYWALALTAPIAVLAAGCGQHSTPQAQTHHHHHHHKKNSGKSSSAPPSSSSPSTAPSSPSQPPTSGSVPVKSATSPSNPVLTSAPPAGGVAGANQVQATVNSVRADGTATVNGSTDYVYLLNLSLRNPTTAMILFQLNDIVVAPTGSGAQFSLNDYHMQGITQQNSLFPYPIVPIHPDAVVVRVPSGRTTSGSITVEVPPASQYSVHIVGTRGAVATFSA